MIKMRITSDFVLVVISLFIATVIWLIAKQGDITTENLSPIKIYLQNIPDNIEIKTPQEEVVIEVQYPKVQKKFVIPSKFKLIIDFRAENIEAGAGIDQAKPIQYPISVQNIVPDNDVPQSVKVVGIRDPKNIWIQAKLLTVSATIKPIVEGNPAKGFVFKKVLVEGKSDVIITGPKKAIKDIMDDPSKSVEVMTEPINIEGKNESFIKTVPLIFPKPFKPIINEIDQVNANVVIEEKSSKKVIEKVPVSITVFSEQLIAYCTPQSVNITIEGPISQIEKINKNSFVFNTKQTVEEKEGPAGKYAIEAKFSDNVDKLIKEKTQIMKIEPADIDIEFKTKQTE